MWPVKSLLLQISTNLWSFAPGFPVGGMLLARWNAELPADNASEEIVNFCVTRHGTLFA